ncbi:hypothetical protein FRC07_003970 [Ceratobasidium sp. 392]|nr:hypothetical protein FRC07_003970 [Ceratobasidium sp. 392]
MLREFNEKALKDLQESCIFGIVCTDVAGMGIDIPDIELVVQFQLPSRFCTLVQQFGRCAQSAALTAIAILIVESKYFDDTKKRLQEAAAKPQEQQAAKKQKADESLDASREVEALDVKPEVVVKSSGSQASSSKSSGPTKTQHRQVMDNFINAHLRHSSTPPSGCRRIAGNQFFSNPAIPQELMATLDSPPTTKRAPNQIQLKDEDPAQWSDIDQGLRKALEIWREEVATVRWGAHHMIGGMGILGDEQILWIVPLARRGAIQTTENLQRQVPKWHYHDRYGAQVLQIILGAYPEPTPQATRPPSTVPDNSPTQPLNPPPPKKIRAIHCRACGATDHNCERLTLA